MEFVSVIHYAETLNNRQCQSSDSKTIFSVLPPSNWKYQMV